MAEKILKEKLHAKKKNSNASANLSMLAYVTRRLKTLNNDVVFLGGCATALFISDTASPDVRATIDLDHSSVSEACEKRALLSMREKRLLAIISPIVRITTPSKEVILPTNIS